MQNLAKSPDNSLIVPWYRQRWPWLLMAGPFIVMIAALYTGWIAMTRPDALVVGDYYKQGKAINVDLRRDRAASNLGLHCELRYDAAAGKIIGRIASNKALGNTIIKLHMAHSTLPEKDIKLNLTPDQNGDFTAPLGMLELARWHVVVDTPEWRLAGIWSWPQQKEISISADVAVDK